jgi:hypothetical protein
MRSKVAKRKTPLAQIENKSEGRWVLVSGICDDRGSIRAPLGTPLEAAKTSSLNPEIGAVSNGAMGKDCWD